MKTQVKNLNPGDEFKSLDKKYNGLIFEVLGHQHNVTGIQTYVYNVKIVSTIPSDTIVIKQ